MKENCKLNYTHSVKVGSGTIRAFVEEYIPEDPRFGNTPFGMRLENGNFMWCGIDKIKRLRSRYE